MRYPESGDEMVAEILFHFPVFHHMLRETAQVEVEHTVDMLVLLLPPAGGDDLQGSSAVSKGGLSFFYCGNVFVGAWTLKIWSRFSSGGAAPLFQCDKTGIVPLLACLPARPPARPTRLVRLELAKILVRLRR